MTPKEKAQELVSKYITNQNSWYLENLVDGLRIAHAKQCALIAVNEIYQANLKIHVAKRNIYWNEVIQEIENL
jgi:hypothetical protein